MFALVGTFGKWAHKNFLIQYVESKHIKFLNWIEYVKNAGNCRKLQNVLGNIQNMGSEVHIFDSKISKLGDY